MKTKILIAVLFTLSVSVVNAQTPPGAGEYTQSADEVLEDGAEPIDTNYVYQYVDTQPKFPGGDNAYKKFLQDNIVYPKASRKAEEDGRVYVSFIIERDGRVTGAKILKGTPYERLNNEALRVVSMLPKWNAGSHNGVPVRCRHIAVVPFMLPEKK